MTTSFLARAALAAAAIAAAIPLAGCDTDNIAPSGRAQAPLSEKTLAELEQKQMDKDSPILVRIFKEEAEAEIWKKNRDGEFALLKTYPVCRWSGNLGPKMKEGDRQAPEGFYQITPGQMNPNSSYYLAFNMGYPNAFDRSWNRTGSQLMVHGDCSSRGCYAMTDEQMVEIYALARESFFGGQKAFQVQSFPFRMTAENLAKHRNSPHLAFWKMLKTGSDHFEVTHQEPKVDVCDKRYVFDAAQPENASRPLAFNARAKCPAYEIPQDIASAVAEKQQRDDTEYVELVSRHIAVVPSRDGIDGGMHPSFYAKLNPNTPADYDDRKPPVIPIAATPGALPRTANNPPAQTVPPAAPQPIEVADGGVTQPIAGDVPLPAVAPLPKQGSAPPDNRPTTIASLLNNIFAARPAEAAPPTAAPVPTPAPVTAIASSKRKPATALRLASAPREAKPAPSRQAAASSAVPTLRPRISDEATSQPAALRGESRTAFTMAAPAGNSVLAGAQPVVPAGSFESRWSGLR